VADLTIVARTARHLSEPSAIPALVKRFKDAGVAEVWVQFKQDDTDEATGGSVFYPSKVAPVAAGYGDDRIGRFVNALDEAGIRVCGWVPAFNDESASQAHPEWRAWTIHEDGTTSEQNAWLCPRHEQAVAYEADILNEVVSGYPQLKAVYTDFIRFDDDYSCGCERCMAALTERLKERGRDAAVTATDIRAAAEKDSLLWKEWTGFRAEAVTDAVDVMRDRIEEAREDMWFGACVLPFSMKDYSFNTQSGQDYYEMARVGLDEIVIMGYWDDWMKSPAWLHDGLKSAADLVKGECRLGVLLDGDMATRRTWLTLDAIRSAAPQHVGYFNYWQWRESDLKRVGDAARAARVGAPPRPAFTAVAVRVDTEPDYERRYDTVKPEMITQLADMFEQEGMNATFVTCGKLSEMDGHREALLDAQRRGHEIACHAYDHEQLDDLPIEEERRVIDQGLKALRAAGLDVTGFGAPRNSITPGGRDYLIERGMAYDGSAAYDPMVSLMDAGYDRHSSGDGRTIMVVPFVMPNDWDALYVAQVDAERMGRLWRERLDRVVDSGEPVFVLDVHQWLASRPDVMAVLREFIRDAKGRASCKLMPLRDAAVHAAAHVAEVEAATLKQADAAAVGATVK